MEATNIIDLRILDLLPDALFFQMLNLVIVGSGKIGAQGAVVAGDNNTTTAGRGFLVVKIFGLDACVTGDLLQGLTVLVLADATKVDNGVGCENVLRGNELTYVTY